MLVEIGRQAALLDRLVEAFAPAAERLGIMLAEAMDVAPFQPLLLGQRAEAAFRHQHTAREDIGLDEVRAARIAVTGESLSTPP